MTADLNKKPSATYCQNCGARLPDDPRFCPRCGKKVGTNAPDWKDVFEKFGDLCDWASDFVLRLIEKGAAIITANGDPNSDPLKWNVGALLFGDPISGALGVFYALRARGARKRNEPGEAALAA